MRSTLALLSVLGAVAAQGVTDPISPDGAAPGGCVKDYDGELEVTVATVSEAKKRSLEMTQMRKRGGCGADGILVMTLKDGVLKDAKDRTGYIASNYQFQFDGPPQAGAIYTAGYSMCGNSTLALGSSTTFYQCKSGDFWNLYDRSWAPQCEAVSLLAMPCGGDSPDVSQTGDGQVIATQLYTTTIVKPISDGQPQVITTVVPVPMCQIGDGQVQGHTTPCASITPAPEPVKPTPGPAPVSQYSDGQIQVTPPAPVTPSPSPVSPAPPPPVTTPAGTAPVPVSSKPAGPGSLSSYVSSASSSPSPSPSPSPAPVSRASHSVQMGSLVALFIGVVAAALFL